MTAPVVVGIFTLAGTVLGVFSQYLVRILGEGHRQRKDALLQALLVVDHVHANTPMGGKPAAPNKHDWDITMAYNALNMMALHCRTPNITIGKFFDAMGVNKARDWRPAEELQKFRNQIRKEMSLFPDDCNDVAFDKDRIAIYELPGGKFPPFR